MGTVLPFLLVLLGSLRYGYSSADRGVQLRVTDKGLQYGMEVAINVFEKDMVGKPLSMKNERRNSIKFNVKRAVIEEAKINKYSLSNIENVGLRAKVSDIYILVVADLSFEYKKWFFRIQDSLSMRAITDGAMFEIDLGFGSRPDGRPTMVATNCKADVGSLSLTFSSSKRSWIYNLLKRIFKGTITEHVNKLLCDMAITEIRERGDMELASFPVIRRIDRYAKIDYRLTEPPKSMADYMDIYVKGEIFSAKSGKRSSLAIPQFSVSSSASKMAYLWLTDYTFNTAGEVYHNSGALRYTVTLEEDELPSLLRNAMKSQNGYIPELHREPNVAEQQIKISKLSSKFPNAELEMKITSSKPPVVKMMPGKLKVFAFSEVVFAAVVGNRTHKAFTAELDVTIVGEVKVINDFITGDIKEFDYNIRLKKSEIGKIDIKVLDEPFVRELIKIGILKQIQPALHKGIPMPTIDDLRFVNSDVEIEKDVLLIRSDCKFVGK